MKFAIVNSKRSLPSKGARGICEVCGSEMIAKICKDKIDHWAHKNKQECDRWWENETPWHRKWKNCFDETWQEVVHKDENTGEIHKADVTTPFGWTIEFQHSAITDEERSSRNNFYKKIVWVVDGNRRKTDIKQLNELLNSSIKLKTKFPTFAVNPSSKNKLLSEWHNKDSLVFFDFNQIDRSKQRIIWFALPKPRIDGNSTEDSSNKLFIQAFPASWFIGTHINDAFDQFFSEEIYDIVAVYSKELDSIKMRYSKGRFPDPRLNWLLT